MMGSKPATTDRSVSTLKFADSSRHSVPYAQDNSSCVKGVNQVL
jgi:hypothetical protein